jgi:hypothetical protein
MALARDDGLAMVDAHVHSVQPRQGPLRSSLAAVGRRPAGGMWAVIVTVFVYRDSLRQTVAAAWARVRLARERMSRVGQ